MSFRLRLLAGVVVVGIVAIAAVAEGPPPAKWMAGDFHQHTLYTDGSTTFDFVMAKNIEHGLDWWANSEHGGERTYDGNGTYWDANPPYPPGTILGDSRTSGGHRIMYRWQSLRDFVWQDILRWRDLLPEKRIISGVEWNVPGHEHCSVGVISQGAAAVSAFEFQFDKSDRDLSRNGEATPFGILTKQNGSGKPSGNDRHMDAVAAARWMQAQYDAGTIDNAWIVFAHIERAGAFRTGSSDGGYNVEHFRDFNNAAPDICFGFEGAPGHQQNPDGRGGFGAGAVMGGTYGGTGYYTAKVGGLWDAMLGEGRRWFNYASSDYHAHWTVGGDDYYPGEYQKNWTYVPDQNRDGLYSENEIADGLRAGNSFHVMGDLVDYLEFAVQDGSRRLAFMGGELRSGKPTSLMVKIRFKTPPVNRVGDSPVVDHIDVIAGNITGKLDPSSPDYGKATNESTKVISRFTARDWKTDKDGYSTVTFQLKDVTENMYLRLRGTNMPPNTPGQTDADGNPLLDSAGSIHGDAEARADLWFYGNPIFVYVK